MGITRQQYKAISKYWEKHGGPNFFDRTPFRMFNISRERNDILQLAKRYYGERNWVRLIESFIGKKFKIKTPHYDIDYLITGIEQYGLDDIDRVEVAIDPNGKVIIDHSQYDPITLTIKEIYDCNDSFEFLDKYYPQVEKDSPQYDEMSYELDRDFFDGDNGFIDSLEEHILSQLSGIITKPYGAEIDYVVMENGKEEQFPKDSNLSEQFDRIKTLINFSDY